MSGKIIEAMSAAVKIKGYVEDVSKTTNGLKGLYDLRKSSDIESYSKVYEAMKHFVSKSPIGKLFMNYYSAGFDLIIAIERGIQDVDKACSDLDELGKKLTEFYHANYGELNVATEFDSRKMSHGPFYYLGELQRQNPGKSVQDPELIKHVTVTIHRAKQIVHILDKLLLVYYPVYHNWYELYYQRMSDLNNRKQNFIVIRKKQDEMYTYLDMNTSISKFLSDLNSHRNGWARWIGKRGNVSENDYCMKAQKLING